MSTQFSCPNSVTIDVANFSLSYDELILKDPEENLILVDLIDTMPSDLFRSIFYNGLDTFSLVKNGAVPYEDALPYVSLSAPYRKYLNADFLLADTIIDFLTTNTGHGLEDYTPCSVINLNKQLVGLVTFYELGGNPTCSLTWPEVVELATGRCNLPDEAETFIVRCAIYLTFITPTVDVKPTRIVYTFLVEFAR